MLLDANFALSQASFNTDSLILLLLLQDFPIGLVLRPDGLTEGVLTVPDF